MLLAAGLAFISRDAPELLRILEQKHAYLPLGQLLFFIAGLMGLVASTELRRGCRNLCRQLRNMRSMGNITRIDSPQADMWSLVSGMNGVLELAEQNVSSSSLKLKELEIQLKVATAERQHAQAIIYSISDAVLVTDPFDELVLANDSAARTFDFDLNAGRAPIDRILHDAEMIGLIREMRSATVAAAGASSSIGLKRRWGSGHSR